MRWLTSTIIATAAVAGAMGLSSACQAQILYTNASCEFNVIFPHSAITKEDESSSRTDGYERSERLGERKEGVVFVRKGDGKSALAGLLPQTQFDSRFLKDWFHDNIVAFLSIGVWDRPKEWQSLSTDEVQRELTRQLASRWGSYSFSLQDSDQGIRWFVNYAGAFVAVSTRVFEDKIVVVESMDFVHVLVAEKTMAPKRDESAEELWNFFRRAANAEDAKSVLRSARPAIDAGRP